MNQSELTRRGPPLEGRSANHFELAFTEFEFLLDFGQAYDTSSEALVHTRIIVTPRSAKALLRMLQQLIEKYEREIHVVDEESSRA